MKLVMLQAFGALSKAAEGYDATLLIVLGIIVVAAISAIFYWTNKALKDYDIDEVVDREKYEKKKAKNREELRQRLEDEHAQREKKRLSELNDGE